MPPDGTVFEFSQQSHDVMVVHDYTLLFHRGKEGREMQPTEMRFKDSIAWGIQTGPFAI